MRSLWPFPQVSAPPDSGWSFLIQNHVTGEIFKQYAIPHMCEERRVFVAVSSIPTIEAVR